MSALQIVSELMDLRDAEVTLLHVLETPWLHVDSDRGWFGSEEEREKDPQDQIDPQVQIEEVFQKEGEEILMAAHDRLPAETAVVTITREGLPADEILSEAESGRYDLVVLGVSGSPDLKHKMLGSVSSKVAWNAPCSVLLAGAAADRE
jgi:nucleotide-binding universal stress UspA family protein